MQVTRGIAVTTGYGTEWYSKLRELTSELRKLPVLISIITYCLCDRKKKKHYRCTTAVKHFHVDILLCDVWPRVEHGMSWLEVYLSRHTGVPQRSIYESVTSKLDGRRDTQRLRVDEHIQYTKLICIYIYVGYKKMWSPSSFSVWPGLVRPTFPNGVQVQTGVQCTVDLITGYIYRYDMGLVLLSMHETETSSSILPMLFHIPCRYSAVLVLTKYFVYYYMYVVHTEYIRIILLLYSPYRSRQPTGMCML